MKASCDTCRFFEPEPRGAEDIYGECRRHPPVVLTRQVWPRDETGWAADVVTEHPVVSPDHWCGEHRPAGPAVPK